MLACPLFDEIVLMYCARGHALHADDHAALDWSGLSCHSPHKHAREQHPGSAA